MIIFLHGSDRYRIFERIQDIETEFAQKNITGTRCSENEIDRIREIIKTKSFFDEARLVIVPDVLAQGDIIAELIEKYNVTSDPATTVVIAVMTDISKLKKSAGNLAKILASKKIAVETFEPLAGIALKQWVDRRIEKYKIKIASSVIDKLIQLTNSEIEKPRKIFVSNSGRLAVEIQKIAHFFYGSAIESIDNAIVEKLVHHQSKENIFAFTDALGHQNIIQALSLLHRQLEQDADPHYLLSMIAYQLRNLAIVRDGIDRNKNTTAIATESGLHPFVVQKTYQQAKAFTTAGLASLIIKLSKLDQSMKDGLVDPTDGLWQFLLDIPRPNLPKMSII